MQDSARARVAAVIGAASAHKKVSHVYDYSAGGYRNATAEVSSGRVRGYDYSTSSHFSGGGPGNLNFYDYETSRHVQLRLDGNRFSGYDYHSGRHFSGSVSGRSISLYDHDTGRHYSYSV